ncbi:MAG: ATP-binding cassette domain-containing protein [Pseudomonadota bacterium]
MEVILRTEKLSKRFGGLVACDNIDFSLPKGAIQCIIGPNGAGKTTFISLISGHLRQSSGTIWFKDREITTMSLIKRAQKGIVRKFQTPTLFNTLTAYENVEISVLGTNCPSYMRSSRVLEVLDLVRLADSVDTPVNSLSHGQRQWLEIGLLIANNAEILLLDEPTAGMTAEETASTAALLVKFVEEFNYSAIIIEHDINFIRELCAPVTVLNMGKVLAEGTFEEIEMDEKVRDVYLGENDGG